VFNPWKHVRLAACLVFLLSQMLGSWPLLAFGFILLFTGLVGGQDLAERRIELLEKPILEEKRDEKAETPEDR
jgi:uncharacterized protein (DUF58 family)